MDSSHALFQPDRVPWNIVVDHKPAKLKVNAFTCSLGCDHYLGIFPECFFRINPGSGLIEASYFHATVDLGDCKSPALKFFNKKVQSLFMFREQQKFHLGIIKNPLFVDHLFELCKL
ncbi:hypothetical protein SDC9_106026 [bioreactor metagenome]|uniref:Uncharacterized protein n=1 Tax=bioreactor metagenome TaxID=1076179 RepID=A0A645B299_9ZZZZ